MIDKQISTYINSLPAAKQQDMLALHSLLQQWLPGCKLWFEDGRNSEGKIVSNPTIGYGRYTIQYANGKTRDFFQIGLSANTTGISIHIMGIRGKLDLAHTFGKELGKANVTGYCIKFKTMSDLNLDILKSAVQLGVETSLNP